jgi:hypothetical protein
MSTSFTSYTAMYPASFDLKTVNILHQTMVYAASIPTGLKLSVAEVLILSLMFFQDLFMSFLSLKYS